MKNFISPVIFLLSGSFFGCASVYNADPALPSSLIDVHNESFSHSIAVIVCRASGECEDGDVLFEDDPNISWGKAAPYFAPRKIQAASELNLYVDAQVVTWWQGIPAKFCRREVSFKPEVGKNYSLYIEWETKSTALKIENGGAECSVYVKPVS